MADAASHDGKPLLCCSRSDCCLCWSCFPREQGTGSGWAAVLVPKEWRQDTKGSLTTEGPEAAEEEASLSGRRRLLLEEEEGLPPIAILWLTPLLNAKLQCHRTTKRPTDWVHLAGLLSQPGIRLSRQEHRKEIQQGKPSQRSFQKPQSQSHLAYTPHSLRQGS